jgi:hypothetical protein
MPIDKETVLATISKSQTEEVRVARVWIGGRDYLSVAVFLKEGGQFKRGLTAAPQVWREVMTVLTAALADPRPALAAALKEAQDEGPAPV